MGEMLAARRARHDRVSASLAARSDAELAAFLDVVPTMTVGVGGGCVVLDIDGVPVLVKRIPITDRELAHPHSTANMFNLPSYCQYGIGGPSFGVWRELAANLIVTEGVLAGETDSFALLHHWRVLPGRPPVASEHLDIDAAVARLGGAPAVRSRLEELASAASGLVQFSEYVHYPLLDWLNEDPVGRAEAIEQQLSEVVAFLRNRELLHMDGHFGNMRSDGGRIYLVDFGLATSPRFDLSDAERDFVGYHVGHDAEYAAMGLVNWLVTAVCGVPVPASGGPVARCSAARCTPNIPARRSGSRYRRRPDSTVLIRRGQRAEVSQISWRTSVAHQSTEDSPATGGAAVDMATGPDPPEVPRRTGHASAGRPHPAPDRGGVVRLTSRNRRSCYGAVVSRIRARALALVFVVLLTACGGTEPAAAPSPTDENGRWACRKMLESSLLNPSEPTRLENAAIGDAAANSTNADTRAAGDALVAAVDQAEGTEPGSVAAADADLAIAKARKALVEACSSQFGNGSW
ncbi:hypothetical protein ACIBJE_02430 [Micromonospora sp. NPDC050187]|uniref:hypothetical protein n=1 Tax=Micromonospora sp. NPDC050187 TaxID=3364277 RepID=UPI0037980D8B